MPTDTAKLVPAGVVSEIIDSLGGESVALRLGRTITMPSAVTSVPVVSVLPVAEFVASGERKPVSQVEWSAEQLVPEEIAVTCWFPQALFDDLGFPAEQSVQEETAKAIARRIDAALLFGDAPPPGWPSDGVVGGGTPVTGATASEALNAGFSAVEADGLEVTGIASGPAIGQALRAEYAAAGALPGERPSDSFWGVPIARTPSWDSSTGAAVVGDWSNLLLGLWREIRFETSTDAILQDPDGTIVANSFQQDLVACRCYARIAAALANPLKPDGSGPTEATFVAVDWT
jgi:HK97 family phage major capsid protein